MNLQISGAFSDLLTSSIMPSYFSCELQDYGVVDEEYNNRKKDISGLIRRMGDHIFGDETVVEGMIEACKRLGKSVDVLAKEDPYYFCDVGLVERISRLRSNYGKLNCGPDEDCCICLDAKGFADRVYFGCRHFVCQTCYYESEFQSGDSKCPICRAMISIVAYSDKYAVVCLGPSTNRYTFDNGGYKSVSIAYFPDFQGEKGNTYSDVTYHDDNNGKNAFRQRIYSLFDAGYTIMLQKYKDVRKWMSDIMLKDLARDPRFRPD